jgi:hypothetical protein
MCGGQVLDRAMANDPEQLQYKDYPVFAMTTRFAALKQEQSAPDRVVLPARFPLGDVEATPGSTFGALSCQPCFLRPPWSFRLRT